jgi:hypothetical protein
MSFGKGTTQSDSNQQSTASSYLNPTNENAQLTNAGANQNLLNTYQPYSGQLVAPTNSNQNQGYASLLNIANSGTGNSLLNSAASTVGNVANFTPSTVQAGQLASTDLTPYLNAGTQDVVNTTMADLERQRQIQQAADNATATAANAFGGSRSAILNAQDNEAADRTEASTLASLNQNNYQSAQQAALSDIANRLTAAQSNQSAGISGAGLNLQAGQQQGALSAQQLSQAQTLANLYGQVGNAQQAQQQAVDTANANQAQQSLSNKMSLQQLINQAYGVLGNPTLSSSQSTGNQSSNGSNFSLNTGLSFSPIRTS